MIYALAAGIALGTLGPVSNLAYGAGMGSATFAALRATVGASVLIAVIRATRHATVPLRELARRDRVLLGLTSVAQAMLSLAIFAAYDAMPIAIVLAVYFCYPLLVAGASIALGRERLTGARALGLVVASTGLVIVLVGGAQAGVVISVIGVALAGLAAICQASYLGSRARASRSCHLTRRARRSSSAPPASSGCSPSLSTDRRWALRGPPRRRPGSRSA